MDMKAPKRQLFQQGIYIFGLLLLSAILGIIVSVTTNYFVSTVKWFSSLRTESIDFFQLNDFQLHLYYGCFLRSSFSIMCENGVTSPVGMGHLMRSMRRIGLIMNLTWKRGLGSTLQHLYRCVVERQLVNMGHS